MNLVNNEEIYMKMNQYQHQQTTKLTGFNFKMIKMKREKKHLSAAIISQNGGSWDFKCIAGANPT